MDIDNRIKTLKKEYGLKVHIEGGWFWEDEVVIKNGEYKRPPFGVFVFLVAKDEINHFHILDCDEVWHFHEGCGMNIHTISPSGEHKTIKFGNDIEHGESPYVIFKKGTTFGGENIDKNSYTFFSGVTIPRFEYHGLKLLMKDDINSKSPLARFYTEPNK